MGNFIDPRCSTPLFRINDSSLAKSCGRLSGYYLSIFASIFFSIVYGMYLYFLNSKYYFDNNIDKYNQSKQTATTVFICVLILLWIGVPILSGYFNVKSWEGYQYQINEFIKNGLSKEAALDKIESTYNAENLARSIRMTSRGYNRMHHHHR